MITGIPTKGEGRVTTGLNWSLRHTSADHQLVELALDVQLRVLCLNALQFDGHLFGCGDVGACDVDGVGQINGTSHRTPVHTATHLPRYMSPNDPDPILRPKRYLFPTRNSIVVVVIGSETGHRVTDGCVSSVGVMSPTSGR